MPRRSRRQREARGDVIEAQPFPPKVQRQRAIGPSGIRRTPSPRELLANARKLTKNGHPIGRPRAYTPEMCEEAVGLGAQGLSKASIAHCFGITQSTLYQWAKEFPAFSEALARAHDACQHWWEQHGQAHLTADRYQAQVWHRSMAARFNEYKDVAPSVNVTIAGELLDSLTQATEARQAKLAARAKPIEAQDVVLDTPLKDQ